MRETFMSTQRVTVTYAKGMKLREDRESRDFGAC